MPADWQAGLRIGLTGGIGSGKSTVARMLADLGARVVDTDAIARSLTAPAGAALPALAACFGPDILDAGGALDRERMRSLVFAQAQARQQLEAILHPLITQQALAEAQQADAGQTVVFDVPLLAESPHWRQRVDRVLVIDCSPEEQVRRVTARSGWQAADVQRVIASQASREQRRAIADSVILNEGISLAELQAQVALIWHAWTPGR